MFSNAPQHYAHAVLKLLRVDDLFDDVMTVEHTRYRPSRTFRLHASNVRHRVKAPQCVMVEDSLENLHAAKSLGCGPCG